MAKPSREEFSEFRTLLDLDAEGRLLLEGVRTVIVPAAILANIERTGRKIMGRGWSGILYEAGEVNGREIASLVHQKLGNRASPETMLQLIADRTELRGLGRVDASGIDLASGAGALTMEDSPLAVGSASGGNPVCYLSAGLWAGVVSVLGGRDVIAEEIACRGNGAPRCEFTFEVVP